MKNILIKINWLFKGTENSFESLPSSMMKVFVMMTGEFDYGNGLLKSDVSICFILAIRSKQFALNFLTLFSEILQSMQH